MLISKQVNGRLKIMLFMFFTFFVVSCSNLKRVANSSSRDKVTKVTEVRVNIVDFAQEYVGVPYKYAGKDPQGFDCSGFTSYVLSKYDIAVSSSSRVQATEGRLIPIDEVKEGDLIFFGKKDKVTHVALVVSNTEDGIVVVHSTSSKGVMTQNISISNYWKPKILFARDVINN